MTKYHGSVNILMKVYYYIYLSLDFKILNCIQCGLVLNKEFGVEFNVHVLEEILFIVKLFYKRMS